MNSYYCEKFDVMFNKDTGKLLEGNCSDKTCEYCTKRPKLLTTIVCNTCDLLGEWCSGSNFEGVVKR